MMAITSTNETGMVSRKSVNEMMQSLLNPDGEPEENPPKNRKEFPFREGDRVVFRDNEWFDLDDDSGNKILVCNGQIGWIDYWFQEKDKQLASISFESGINIIADMRQGSWQLAYAITCHISQGSQFKYVAVCVGDDYGAHMVMSREWFTTACSRAQLYTCTIGRWENIEKACKKSDLGVRHTRLTEMIEECLPSETPHSL